jgi:hypothetical protein
MSKKKKTRQQVLDEIAKLPPEEQKRIFDAAYLVAETVRQRKQIKNGSRKPH